MKTNLLSAFILALLVSLPSFAQDKTTVKANSSDISDNLDLRAVATIFGDASDLEDFERRLNDPKSQISNLDLNEDNYVDYLRVIESTEQNVHIIVVQAVLGKDLYQDVASIEVEKDANNNVQVQVVGDVYMYGDNYIYEPVYVHRPVIYTNFWVTNYRPYCSTWYWNYYPTYYTYWNPFPIFRYRNNIALHINFGHSYHYVTNRRCSSAYYSYYGRRGNGYETRYPNRSFHHRNNGYTNRHDYDQNRNVNTRVPGSRELVNNNSPRGNSSTRGNSTRTTEPRATSSTRGNSTRTTEPRATGSTRGNSSRTTEPRATSSTRENSPRSTEPRATSSSRNNSPRTTSAPRSNSPRTTSSSRGSSQPRSTGATRGSNSNSRSSSNGRSSGGRNN